MKSWQGVLGFLNMVEMLVLIYSGLTSMHMFLDTTYDTTTCVLSIIFSVQAFTRTFTYWLNQEKWRQLRKLVLEDPGHLTLDEKETFIKLKKIYRMGFIFTIASYYAAVYMFSVIAAFSSEEYMMPLNFQIPFTK